jgi:hypothetical protein
LFFYETLELFRQCGIIDFCIGLWRCSDIVALFVCIWDFGTVLTVWHYLFFQWINQSCHIVGRVPKSNRKTNNATWSEQFQSPIEKQIMLHCRTVPKSNRRTNNATWYGTLELFWQCGIICFSIGLWICSDSVALFVSLLNFGTIPTMWHYLFFYWTL